MTDVSILPADDSFLVYYILKTDPQTHIGLIFLPVNMV